MIEHNKVKKFWADRAAKNGKRTVGFANTPLDKQDEYYRKRIEFMLPHMDTGLFTLDYGCGVGRFSYLFGKDKYLGVDVTGQLLDIAIEENPGYNYLLLDNPDLVGVVLPPVEQFFSSTVLQHNSDGNIMLILSSLRGLPIKKFTLYEATAKIKSNGHMNFKSFDDYTGFIGEYFNISRSEQHKFVPEHLGVEHSLMIFDIDGQVK